MLRLYFLSVALVAASGLIGCAQSFRCGGYTPTFHVDRSKAPLNEWPGQPAPTRQHCVVACELDADCVAVLFDETFKMCYLRPAYYAYNTFSLNGAVYETDLHYIENVLNTNCTETLEQQSELNQCNVAGQYTKIKDISTTDDSCHLYRYIRQPPVQIFASCQDVLNGGINLTRPYMLDQGVGPFEVLCVFNDTSVWEQYLNCSDAFARGAPTSNTYRLGSEMYFCEISATYGRRVYLSCEDVWDKGLREHGQYSLADLSGIYSNFQENYCDLTEGAVTPVFRSCSDASTKGHTLSALYRIDLNGFYNETVSLHCQMTPTVTPVYTSCAHVWDVLGSTTSDGAFPLSISQTYSDTASILCKFGVVGAGSVEVYNDCQDVAVKGNNDSALYYVTLSGNLDDTELMYCHVVEPGLSGFAVYADCVDAINHGLVNGTYTIAWHQNYSNPQSVYCETTATGAQVVFNNCSNAYDLGNTTDGFYTVRQGGNSVSVFCTSTEGMLAFNTTSLVEVFTDCGHAFNLGWSVDGTYVICPGSTNFTTPTYTIRCEFFNNAGWNVLQRRYDGTVNFRQDWEAYKQGFGNLGGEHWTGNDMISMLTPTPVNLYIRLERDGVTKYASYSSFTIGTEATHYELSVSGYSGDAGDSLSWHDGMRFTTIDMDNDRYSGGSENCAMDYGGGGWWYNDCYSSNLNGLYDRPDDDLSGNVWEGFSNCNCSVSASTMLVKLT